MLRFMLETGTRAGEVVSLKLADVELAQGRATIRRGKGGKAVSSRWPRRPPQDAPHPRRQGRHRGLPSAPAEAHRRPPPAHRGLAAGGLMAVAGWTRPDILMRYTKAQASARDADEAKRLNLGEL